MSSSSDAFKSLKFILQVSLLNLIYKDELKVCSVIIEWR